MAFISTPIIQFFRAERTRVMAGEKILLEWEIDNAEKAKLDVIDVDPKSNYQVVVSAPAIYELSAGSWTKKVTETVEINLLTPAVLDFRCEQKHITEGSPVMIHMQIKHALNWQLVAEYAGLSGNMTETVGSGRIDDGYKLYNHSAEVMLKGNCTLRLLTFNGPQAGPTDFIRLAARPLSVELRTDRSVVKAGAIVPVRWLAQHATKLVLIPGEIDVTGFTSYELVADGKTDLLLEIRAWGDFGQFASDDTRIFIARFNKVYCSNNGDIFHPRFYLNWSATGISRVRLMPDNIILTESFNDYEIKPSSEPVKYTLVAETYSQEEITEQATLIPCSVEYFQLESGWAIVGNKSRVKWSIRHARKIQLQFSDNPVLVEIPVQESSYEFQVFETTGSIKMFAWGDVNLVEAELPVPRFNAPVIKLINIPAMSLQLGVSWMRSPAIPAAKNIAGQFIVASSVTRKSASLLGIINNGMSGPSQWLFRKTGKMPKFYRLKREPAPLHSGLIFRKIQKLLGHITKQLHKENFNHDRNQ